MVKWGKDIAESELVIERIERKNGNAATVRLDGKW